jgi:hypothetical protein
MIVNRNKKWWGVGIGECMNKITDKNLCFRNLIPLPEYPCLSSQAGLAYFAIQKIQYRKDREET